MEKIEINEYPFESDLVLNALTSKKTIYQMNIWAPDNWVRSVLSV